MTPAIDLLKKQHMIHLVHEYTHDSNADSYGQEAAEKLGVPSEQVFKTLVVELDTKELAVGVLPVSAQLSMKQIAKALGAKKAKMADKNNVLRSTGYVLGGVSPIGQRKKLSTVIDLSALKFDAMYISAGRRGLEISLHANDLQQITAGKFADICHVSL